MEGKMETGKYFSFERKENIGILTINNMPLNIFGEGLYRELLAIENQLDQEVGLRAMIINANGKFFSAGIDLNFLKSVNSQFVLDNLGWMQKIYNYWDEQPYPVIAAVQGLVTGSGVELMLGCDLRVIAEGTKISMPEVKFGLSPDMGGTSRLTRLVGVGTAKRIMLTCEEIDAAEAYRIGMCEYLVSPDKLMDKAMELATKMASYPPAAVRFAKKGIEVTYEGGLRAGLLFEQAQSTYCCGSQDQKDALQAFLQSLHEKK